MISSNLKFKKVISDRLFYDRWNYCVKFYLPEITALRDSLDPNEILRVIQTRKEWRSYARHRWPMMNVISDTGQIEDTHTENLLSLADFLSKQDKKYKITISVNHAWVYSNDLDLIDKITQLNYLKIIKLTQVDVARPRDCVQLKTPQHSWRSYLRSCKLTGDEKNNLRNFLSSQQDIRIGTGLAEWLNNHWGRTQDYYFIDHNGKGFETMLSLVTPNIIRKTLAIVAK